MANNTNNIRTGVIDIPGALRPLGGADSSTNQVGGVVAYTGDIYDVTAGKNQAALNAEFAEGIANAGGGSVTDVQVKEYDEDSYATVVDANGVAKIDLSSIDDQIDAVNNLIGVNDHHGDLFTRMQAVEKQTEKSSDCQIDVQPIFSYIQVTGDASVYKIMSYQSNPMNSEGVREFILSHSSSISLCTYTNGSPDLDVTIGIDEVEVDEDDDKVVLTLDEDLGELTNKMLGIYCKTSYMSIAYGTYLTVNDSVVVGQSNIANDGNSVSIGRGNYSKNSSSCTIGSGNKNLCYLNGTVAGFNNTIDLSTNISVFGTSNTFRACNGSFIGGSQNTSMSSLLLNSVAYGGNCVGYSNYMPLFYYNVFGLSNNLVNETSELFEAYGDGDYHMGQVIGRGNTIVSGLGNNVVGSSNSLSTGNPCESNVYGHHNTFPVSNGLCFGNDNTISYYGSPYTGIINIGNSNTVFGSKTINIGTGNQRSYASTLPNPITMIGLDLYDDNSRPVTSSDASSGWGWSLYDTSNTSSPGLLHLSGATILGSKNYKYTFSYYRDGILLIGCGGANDNDGKSVLALRSDGSLYLQGVGGWNGNNIITPLIKSVNDYISDSEGLKPLETSDADSFYKYMSLPAVDLYVHTMSVSGHSNYLLEIYTTSNIELVDVATLKHYDPNVSGKVKITTSVSLTNSSELVTTSIYNNSAPFTVTSTVTGTMPRWCGDMYIPTINSNDYDEVNNVAISGTYLKYIFIPNAFVKDANDNVYRAVWHNIGQSYTKGTYGTTILGTSPCNTAGTYLSVLCMPLNGTINKPNDL